MAATLNADKNALVAFTEFLMAQGVTYQMGAKAVPIDAELDTIHALDCSGFVQLAIWHKADHLLLPEGSVEQHAYFQDNGYEAGTPDECLKVDNILRAAFLPPLGFAPGHAMLVLNGLTLECHGHKGVDRRQWSELAFTGKCAVYLLTP